MRSMTGYAKAVVHTDELLFEIEIKSVNSKHLDIRTYIPREMNWLEPRLRNLLSQTLGRGAIDIKIQFSDHREPKLSINKAKLKKYYELYQDASEALGIDSQVSLEALLKEQGMIETGTDYENDEALNRLLSQALDTVIGRLLASTSKEGESIKQVLLASTTTIRNAVNMIEELLVPYRENLFENLLARMNEILSAYKISNLEQRLVQELALYIDKYDIHEEISRIKNHIDTFERMINDYSEENKGKTLYFITQELQRESNTLGSKFSTSDSFKYVLTLKEEVEKCREVVLNVT